jgi:hypothetical protein
LYVGLEDHHLNKKVVDFLKIDLYNKGAVAKNKDCSFFVFAIMKGIHNESNLFFPSI